ncbi:MAG: two-component system sensor histidine kinase NtrB [Terriglobales bacterium]
MNPASLNLVFYLTAGLALVCLLGIAVYAIHRLTRRPSREMRGEADTAALPATWPTPPGILVDMVARLKRQDAELETLRREVRLRDQDSLRVSRDLLSHLPSGIVFFDRQGVVQQANPAARSALGFASPQGLRASELFRDAQVQNTAGGQLGLAATLVYQALETGNAVQRQELAYRTPDGEDRRLGITFSPVTAAALGPGREREDGLGLICLLTDLTAIRALETELRRRQSLASLGEMSAGIAHEFKNALATISGYAQMLAAGLASAPDQAELAAYTTCILDQTAALSQMANEFLLFARPVDTHLEPLPLLPLLLECVEEIRGLNWPDIEFRWEPLRPEAGAWRVLGDPVLLRRVWLNLLRNAAEAIVSAGAAQPGLVTIGVEAGEEVVRVRVSDNGPGVPKELADKVFIPFFTTKSTGSGLGLAVVHKITAAHQGVVSLGGDASGAVFTVSLPLAPVARAAAGHPAS